MSCASVGSRGSRLGREAVCFHNDSLCYANGMSVIKDVITLQGARREISVNWVALRAEISF